MSENGMQRRTFLTAAAAVATAPGVVTGAEETPKGPVAPEEIDELLGRMLEKRGEYYSVAKEDGKFLNFLVKTTRAKRVLEVGTSQGYSTTWISLGLQETDGAITTVEIDPERVKLAKKNLAEAGLDHRVTFLEGNAHEVVTTLDGPFDLVFLDADKGREKDYFNKLHPDKLAEGAVLVVHNALMFNDQMKPYLEMMERRRDFDAMIVRMTPEDGMSVAYRRCLVPA